MKLAVLGSPIAHSKSPALHRAAYRALGLDWQYEAVDLSSADLEAFIASRTSNWRGLSLTMPLKREVMRLLNNRDEFSALTGAANTILFRATADGTALHGFNTDVCGITEALRASGVHAASTVHILGAGATASSAIVAVKLLGAQKITLAVRDLARADYLVGLLEELELDFSFSLLGDPAEQASVTAQASPAVDADLVISTLPGGSQIGSIFSADLRHRAPLLDVAYDPWPSALALRWLDVGGTVISGLEMLMQQALLQVRIFVNGSATDALPDESAVFSAMRDAVSLPVTA